MIRVQIPTAEFISANDRLHWAEKAPRVRAIRQRAALAARGLPATIRKDTTE